MEKVMLNNGVEIPLIGLGTHGIPNSQLPMVLDTALGVGYRKFDTAWLYQNEEVIGTTLKKIGVPRHELFLTSKLHVDDMYSIFGYHRRFPTPHKSVRKAFEQSCKRLQTDYIDLYLVHWPFANFEWLWYELMKLCEKGLVRAIGVSSFLPEHLNLLMKDNVVVPAVNQFEVNPFNAQVSEVEYNQTLGIHVEAYATFGTTKMNESASEKIIQNPLICDLASKHKKTPSQLILRWTLQRGISVIPRSNSRQHLMENLDVFDFELTDDEMTEMLTLDKKQYSRGNPHLA